MAGKILSELLLRMLVCPVCHQPVAVGPEPSAPAWLRCTACGRYYPVQDGIPVMLEHRATFEPPLL